MTPSRWLVLTVGLPDGADGGLAADTLVALGATAVEEEGRTLVTHLPAPESVDEVLDGVSDSLKALPSMEGVTVEWRWQAHEEWAETWKRGLAARPVGRRLMVVPTWIEPPVDPDRRVIRIDPGVAFGTAEHATTRMSLALLERFCAAGDVVIDAGAGTGILSIAALLLGAERATAVESDPMACEAARENLVLNPAADRVRIVEAELDAPALGSLGPADGVVANIQSGVLRSLLPGAAVALADGGWLILSGVLRSEAEEMTAAATDLGFRLVDEETEEEWWCGGFRYGPSL